MSGRQPDGPAWAPCSRSSSSAPRRALAPRPPRGAGARPASAQSPKPAASRPAAPARAEEIRGLWVLRGSLTRPDRIDRLVQSASRSGFNTLLLQVRGRGDAYYDSAIEPRGAGVAGTFDPLAYAIAAADKAGLRVHVWFNTNLVASTALMPTSRTHVVNAHPEWLMVPRPIAADLARLGPRHPRYVPRLVEWTKRNAAGVEGLYASPVTPDAAQYVERVITDIVTRYPVSGVHLDYIRYPSNLFDHSQASLSAFRDSLQRELSPSDRQRLDDRLRRDPLVYADAFPGALGRPSAASVWPISWPASAAPSIGPGPMRSSRRRSSPTRARRSSTSCRTGPTGRDAA